MIYSMCDIMSKGKEIGKRVLFFNSKGDLELANISTKTATQLGYIGSSDIQLQNNYCRVRTSKDFNTHEQVVDLIRKYNDDEMTAEQTQDVFRQAGLTTGDILGVTVVDSDSDTPRVLLDIQQLYGGGYYESMEGTSVRDAFSKFDLLCIPREVWMYESFYNGDLGLKIKIPDFHVTDTDTIDTFPSSECVDGAEPGSSDCYGCEYCYRGDGTCGESKETERYYFGGLHSLFPDRDISYALAGNRKCLMLVESC